MDRELSYFLEGLQKARGSEESWHSLSQYCEGMGVDYLHWCFGLTMSALELQSTCPDWWMPFYMENEFYNNDAIFDHYLSGHGILPYGIDKQGRNPRFSEEFVKTLNVGRHYLGTGTGISFPMFSPTGKRIGGVNIGISGTLETLERMPGEQILNLCLAANATYAKMYLLRSFGMDRIELTPRERECLQYLAQGLRTKEISAKLKVSDATVLFHLNNAKAKLGAQTRDQALGRAMAIGLIDP